MADVLGKKISELAETTDLAGLYTIGSDRNNQSKKVPLQFVKEAADYANAQGDYAKGVGDTIQGNTGVNEYPAFSSSTQYAAGSVVCYNNKLYRFTALHPAGAWVGTDAIETSIKAETDVKLTELESNLGKFEQNNEYIRAYTDSNGKFLWGIRVDGSIEWAIGVPTPIKQYIKEIDYNNDAEVERINQLVINLISVVNKLEEVFETDESNEWLQVLLDNKGKILGGRNSHGEQVEKIGFLIGEHKLAPIKNSEWMNVLLDSNGKIIEGITINGEKIFSKLPPQIYNIMQLLQSDLNDLSMSINKSYPMINIGIDYEMDDFSEEIDGVRFLRSNESEPCMYMEDVYRKFDELCALFPDLISKYEPMADGKEVQEIVIDGKTYKIDINPCPEVKEKMASMGVDDYPNYAKGLSASNDANNMLVDTPSYKTYMYKISYHNTDVYGADMQKKNLFINAGTHGWEVASSFNTYLLAHGLCTKSHRSQFYMKLLSSFDIWLQPCLNGYAIYHGYILGASSGYYSYLNYNGVDINHNYPTKNWIKNEVYHSGNEAGDQFETKLMMSWLNYIKPEIFVDHHTSNEAHRLLYTEAWDEITRHPIFQSLVDLSHCCLKNLSEVLGTDDFRLFFNPNFNHVDLPKQLGQGAGVTSQYAYENITPLSLTIEVFDRLLFRNGSWQETGIPYTNEAFKIAECSLRFQLTHLINTLMIKMQNIFKN